MSGKEPMQTISNPVETPHTEQGGRNRRILHVMVMDKFLPPFIDFTDRNFGRENHQYVFISKERYEYGLTPGHKVTFLHSIDGIFVTLLDLMKNAGKIILHGLWSGEIDILLYFNQDLLKKCYWVMWGGDYYYPERQTKVRKQIIQNMGHVINYTAGDYELVKKWYGTRAERHQCFAYLSNTFIDYSHLKNDSSANRGKKAILIGNSADPANFHLRILEKISAFRDADVEVICPLSYGDQAYRDKVLQAGMAVFGGKFRPLIDFIPFDAYMKILANVDVAVFAHRRQQGMGNIRTLLGLGKKVYIRDDITSWRALQEIGVTVYAFNKDALTFDFPEHLQAANIQRMKENFSYARLIADWTRIFSD